MVQLPICIIGYPYNLQYFGVVSPCLSVEVPAPYSSLIDTLLRAAAISTTDMNVDFIRVRLKLSAMIRLSII